MCGFFGATSRVAPDALDRVSAALWHRGPDSEGRLVTDDMSLLHRRLKIIDLSAQAAQPMANEDGSVQVVFNGEIYNHRALRAELASDHRFKSVSDTEVIVHGYETWSDAVLERLDGMFAVAIWDAKQRRLLLARDRAGKKPLYYRQLGGQLHFASTIGALTAAGGAPEVNLSALPFYLAYGFVPTPDTLHHGIAQLPPAGWLLHESGKPLRHGTYWTPRFGARTTDEHFVSASRRVRTLVTAAVERRLEADVPLGAFLSGGIDSTIVVGVMAKRLGRLRTFSIGFAGDPRYDETEYARLAAHTFGTDHTEFTLEPSSFELVEDLVKHHDGPFGDSSAIPTYVVAKLTRQHVTVALTGDGGDELFCGYSRFLAAELAERVPVALRSLASALVGWVPATRSERALLHRGQRFLQGAALPLTDRLARWNSFFPDPGAVLRGDLRDHLGRAVEAPLDWQRSVFASSEGQPVLARVLEHNFRTYLPFDLLVKADRTSMANSLETRSPFLDTALVEYAARLPPSYLRRGRHTKVILKHAFRDLLPERILHRGKMGFGVPLGTWFRGDLRSYLRDHLGPGARLHEFLERSAVDRLLSEHDGQTADHGQKLWALLTLEVWLRAHARAAAARAA
jgi:asparagine synthase (glutamine-hydrolysing)